MNFKPVIFLAFANDKVDNTAYLRNLSLEQYGIRKALAEAASSGLCEIVERSSFRTQFMGLAFQFFTMEVTPMGSLNGFAWAKINVKN